MQERDAGPTIKLVSMVIVTDEIDVSNDEAILKDGECVGYVTSGGYAQVFDGLGLYFYRSHVDAYIVVCKPFRI
jgi:hypothetical protein